MKPKPEDLYAKAKSLAVNPDDNFWELGRVLARLNEIDKTRFRALWADERISRRKTYYLIEVYERLKDLPISRARLRKIGWTKLQLIAPYVTAVNADELVTLAETATAQVIKKTLEGKPPAGKQHCVLMYFDGDQFDLLVEALEPYGATFEGRAFRNKETALLAALADLAKLKGA